MAYISTERVSEIRNEIKKAFPGFKFSITKDGYSGVIISIMEAPVLLTDRRYEDVNIYTVCRYDYPKGQKQDVLKKILEIATEGVTYHETGDYGTQPSFYTYIKIGQWDKPFKYIATNGKGKPQLGIKVKSLKAA